MSVRRCDITLILQGANYVVTVVYAALSPFHLKDERISLMYCKIAYKTSSSFIPPNRYHSIFFLFYAAFHPNQRPSHIREWLRASNVRPIRADVVYV